MNTANNKGNPENWNVEMGKAYNEFKKRRRSLPSPPDADGNANNMPKKTKRFERVNKRTFNSVKSPVDINHTVVHENNDFQLDTNLRNSTMSEQFMSMETSESAMDLTEVQCDEFDMNLANTLEMIKNKADPHSILETLVSQISQNNKKTQDRLQKINEDYTTRCNYLNDQLVKLENSVIKKINYVIEKNDERFRALEISKKCLNENNVLWLSFTDPKEIDELRVKTKNELIRETKNIFSRMNIRVNSMNRVIMDVMIQKIAIKTGEGYDNELIMGVKFLNSAVVRDLKFLAIKFTKDQFASKNYDAIRYIIRDNWSADIWKLLRVCYDLNNFKLIEKAHVSDAGIMVHYINSENHTENATVKELNKTLIRTESDLDELRSYVKDVGLEMPTFQLYNSEYFKLNADGRQKYKESLNRNFKTPTKLTDTQHGTQNIVELNGNGESSSHN
jgi:hypothetical protein